MYMMYGPGHHTFFFKVSFILKPGINSTTNNKMGKVLSKKHFKPFKVAASNLQNLPEEVLLKIFSYLNNKELLRCAQVSKRIRLICNDYSYCTILGFSISGL